MRLTGALALSKVKRLDAMPPFAYSALQKSRLKRVAEGG
jgi:hypothetical protein